MFTFAGIIRKFLAAALIATLTMTVIALTAATTMPRAGNAAMDEATLKTAQAMAGVVRGEAFPLLIKDIKATAQLRDIAMDMNGAQAPDGAVVAELGEMGLGNGKTDAGLLARAHMLLQKVEMLLGLAETMETGTPAPGGNRSLRNSIAEIDSMIAGEAQR